MRYELGRKQMFIVNFGMETVTDFTAQSQSMANY